MRNYLVRRNGENGVFSLFDGMFDDFFKESIFSVGNVRADVVEKDGAYEFAIDIPGCDKNDIKLSLDNGYVNISANRSSGENSGYLRRERSVSFSRSFYVGDGVEAKDVKAKYENGTVYLTVKKPTEKDKKESVIELE